MTLSFPTLCIDTLFLFYCPTGSKESAFIHSITSAAVAYQISRACSSGNLTTCSCARPGKRRKKREELLLEPQPTDWKWGGCSDNVNYGVKFSQRFTDAPGEELHESLIGANAMANLHNNKVGRKVDMLIIKIHIVHVLKFCLQDLSAESVSVIHIEY